METTVTATEKGLVDRVLLQGGSLVKFRGFGVVLKIIG